MCKRMALFLQANKLGLNVPKTEFLLIGSRYNPKNIYKQPSINVDNKSVKQVTEIKVLGVKIDQYLVWDKHVVHIAKKRASGIGAIRRIKISD